MKTTTLFLLMVLTTGVCAQQTQLDFKVPSRVEHDLFGPVKSTRTVYETKRFLSTSTPRSTLEYERFYDPNGNVLKTVNIDVDDGTTNTTDYIYNPDGCLTGRVYSASNNKTNKIYRYTIDVPSRQMLRENLSNNDRRVVVYNPQGYEYYVEERDSSNTVEKVTKIKRQPNNKEYEFEIFDGDGKHLHSTYLEWNSNGLLREYRYHRPGTNEYLSITRYTHPKKDEQGNWLKRVAKKDRVNKDKKEAYSEEIAVREIEYYDDPPPASTGL